MKTIAREALKQKMEDRDYMTLIEVLPRENVEEFHLPGGFNTPPGADSFEKRVQGAAEKDEEVIVYCQDRTCDASLRAARRVECLEYSSMVAHVARKDDWRAADLAVECPPSPKLYP